MSEKTDAQNLRTLADWFDAEQAKGRWRAGSSEVQDDLRRIADGIDSEATELATVIRELERKLETLQNQIGCKGTLLEQAAEIERLTSDNAELRLRLLQLSRTTTTT